jgi:hypothetical protein
VFVPKAENISELTQYVAFLRRRKDIVVSRPVQAQSQAFLSSCLHVRCRGIRMRASERDADIGR